MTLKSLFKVNVIEVAQTLLFLVSYIYIVIIYNYIYI